MANVQNSDTQEQDNLPLPDGTPAAIIPVQGPSSNQINTSCPVTNVSRDQIVATQDVYNIQHVDNLIINKRPQEITSSQSTQTEHKESKEKIGNEEDASPISHQTDPAHAEENSNVSDNLISSSKPEPSVSTAPSPSVHVHGSNNLVVVIHGSDNKLELPKELTARIPKNQEDEEVAGNDAAGGSGSGSGGTLDATDDGRPLINPEPPPLSLHTGTTELFHDNLKIQLGEDLMKTTSEDTTPTPDSAPVYPFSSPPQPAYSHASTIYSPTHTTDSDLSESDGNARLSVIDESEVPSPKSTDGSVRLSPAYSTDTSRSPDNRRCYSPTTPVLSDISAPSTPDADNPPQSPDEAETPWEIMVRGEKAQEAYMRACRLGTKKVYRTRLMLVGQERVGKTSLLKSLIGKEHNKEEEITDGVDTTIACKVPIADCTRPWEVQHTDKKDRVRHVNRQYNKAVGSSMAKQLLQMSQDEEELPEDMDNSQKVETPSGYTPSPSLEVAMDYDEDQGNATNSQNSQSPRKISVPHEITTEALQRLHEGSVDEEHQDRSEAECVLDVQFWDFAGQDIYYTTHQVFLNRRAIFVLVYDASQDLNLPSRNEAGFKHVKKESHYHNFTGLEFLHFWLQSVYAYAVPTSNSKSNTKQPQCTPPVFVVGTHRDGLSQTEISDNHEAIFGAIAEKPYEKHVIRQIYIVDNCLQNKMDPKLVDLRDHLAKVAMKEPYMGEKIPIRWLQFEKAITEIVANNTTHMTINEVRDLARSLKIKQTREFYTMLQFFHDVGCIVYFGGDKRGRHNQALRDVVVLDPQWLIDVFKRIITVKPNCNQWPTFSHDWRQLRDEGILAEELIDHVWKDLKDLKPTFISLMEMFDLLCPQYIPVKDDNNTKDAKIYYVPACLQQSETTKHQSDEGSEEDGTFYVDFEEFLPDGLFHRVLVHFASWSQEESRIKPKLHFRHGTFYVGEQKNRHRVELYLRPSDPACIKVVVQRPKVVSKHRKRDACCHVCPRICSKVQKKLESVLDIVKQTCLHGIQYSFKLPCEACCGLGVHNVAPSGDATSLHLLDFNECTHRDLDTVFCDRSGCDVETESYRKRFKSSESEVDQAEDQNQNNLNTTDAPNNANNVSAEKNGHNNEECKSQMVS